jgi:hypothetical protein
LQNKEFNFVGQLRCGKFSQTTATWPDDTPAGWNVGNNFGARNRDIYERNVRVGG